jgi:hypothetical protein
LFLHLLKSLERFHYCLVITAGVSAYLPIASQLAGDSIVISAGGVKLLFRKEFPRVETRGLSTVAVNSPYGERLWNIRFFARGRDFWAEFRGFSGAGGYIENL